MDGGKTCYRLINIRINQIRAQNKKHVKGTLNYNKNKSQSHLYSLIWNHPGRGL